MKQALATQPSTAGAEVIEQALIGGDLAGLKPQERVAHYLNVCNSLGLNPHTKPFGYLTLNGKTILYALREAAEQLRSVKGVSITSLEGKVVDDLYIVTATAKDAQGRVDSSTGAVTIAKLTGDAKANAIMKAETKAKRRVTLSICGLGMLDESEIHSIKDARVVDVEVAHVSVNLNEHKEEAPQQEAPKPADLSAAADLLPPHASRLQAATTLDELKAAWEATPSNLRPALASVKDDVKKFLTGGK